MYIVKVGEYYLGAVSWYQELVNRDCAFRFLYLEEAMRHARRFQYSEVICVC